MNRNSRSSDATHEAGHAICIIALGGDVESVDIVRSETRVGICRFIPPAGIVNRLAIDLAGPLAEYEARMRRGEKYDFTASSDLRAATEILAKRYGGAVDPADCDEFKQAEALATRIVGLNWGAISRLADWLLEHETASGKLAKVIFLVHKQRGLERGKDLSMRCA